MMRQFGVRFFTLVSVLSGGPVWAGSLNLPEPIQHPQVADELQAERVTQIERVMLHLNAGEKNTGMIPEVYADDAVFVDPLFPEGLRGHESLLRYHTALNAMIETFEVKVQEVQQQGNDIMVFWQAQATLNIKINFADALKKANLPTLGHKLEVNALKIGPVAYDGMSRFSFADGSSLIQLHRDYYDSLPQYETIPGLKQILGIMKQQSRKGLMPNPN